MRKQWFSARHAVTVVLVTFVLSLACSAVAGAKVIELRFWHGYGNNNDQLKLQELAARFNKLHPNIKVVPEVMVQGSVDKLIAALAAGVPPDIFWQTGSLITQTETHLVPLDKFIDAEPGFRADHFPGLWQDAQWKGITYGIPFEHASEGMGFVISHFLEAGLDLKGPQTWDELQLAARKLTDPQRNRDGVNLSLNDPSWATSVLFGSFLATNGGWFMTPDEKGSLLLSKELVETFEFMHELVQVNRVSSNRTPWLSGGTSMSFDLPGRLLGIGKAGAQLDGNLGTGMIPAKVKRGSINTSKNLFIIRSTPEREAAAWEFIKWLVSPEINFEWHVKQKGYLPTRRSVVRMPEFQKWLSENPIVMPWLQQAEYVLSRPRGPHWDILNKNLRNAFIASIIDGRMGPRPALEEAERLTQVEFAEIK